MNILFISALYPPRTKGGGELSTHYIAEGLVARGHRVRVVTTGDRRSESEVGGISLLQLPVDLTGKPLLERRHSKNDAKILAREIDNLGHYDIVHAHDFRSAMVLSELEVPRAVVTARDYAQICGSTNNILHDGTTCTCSWKDVLRNQRVVEAPWPRRLFRIWQYRYNISYRKSSFRSFDHQIFISQAERREIAKQQDLSSVRTAVIYNPVPRDFLAERVADGGQGNVLYVGRVEMYKGVGLLLEAWRVVAARFPHTHLKIVGEGAQQAEYERMVERWGLQYRVRFVGRIPWDRMRAVYDQASVVVSPHIWVEPFGRTVAEGMARGKVVVAADLGGPAEMIRDNVTGLLFKQRSVDALAVRLGEALGMRDLMRREMQREARSWVAQNLNQDIIASQHESFYAAVVKAPRREKARSNLREAPGRASVVSR